MPEIWQTYVATKIMPYEKNVFSTVNRRVYTKCQVSYEICSHEICSHEPAVTACPKFIPSFFTTEKSCFSDTVLGSKEPPHHVEYQINWANLEKVFLIKLRKTAYDVTKVNILSTAYVKAFPNFLRNN